jgi:arsenate reductase
VKKARRWLDEHAVPYRFHDFRSDGLEPGVLAAWMDTLGWEVLINRRSSSWRELDPETREFAWTPQAPYRQRWLRRH